MSLFARTILSSVDDRPRSDDHRLARGRRELDAVALARQELVVGAVAAVTLAAVDLADAEEERHAAPRLGRGGLGPGCAVAAGSGAGVIRGAIERVGLALAVLLLQPGHLHRPVRHGAADGHVAHPLDHQVAVGDLVLVRRLGHRQPQRALAVRRRADRLAVVLIGHDERDRRLGGLHLSGGRVVHRDAGAAGDLVVLERHAVVVAGGHVDRLLRRQAARRSRAGPSA